MYDLVITTYHPLTAALFCSRMSLVGVHTLYQWSILENHISLLPTFLERSLSYAQTHFWYVFKLVYPRYLCFDYGFACMPTVHGWSDPRNVLPLLVYGLVLRLGVSALQAHTPLVYTSRHHLIASSHIISSSSYHYIIISLHHLTSSYHQIISSSSHTITSSYHYIVSSFLQRVRVSLLVGLILTFLPLGNPSFHSFTHSPTHLLTHPLAHLCIYLLPTFLHTLIHPF